MPKNLETARKFALPAAQWGLPQAEYEMGIIALEKNEVKEARQWLEKAKSGGYAQANETLDKIEKK